MGSAVADKVGDDSVRQESMYILTTKTRLSYTRELRVVSFTTHLLEE